MCLSSDYAMHICCKMSDFSIPRRTYYGRSHVTDLASDDPHNKIRDIQSVRTRGLIALWKSLLPEKDACHGQRCEVAAFCDRAEVYLWCHSVICPDLKTKEQYHVWLEWGSFMTNFSSLSQTAPEQSRENRLGVAPTPSPRPTRVSLFLYPSSICDVQC